MAEKNPPLELTRLPTPDELHLLRDAIASLDVTERNMQALLQHHPSLLAPLEFAEFVRELRLDKRDLSDRPAAHRSEQRIPDVTGVRLFPLDTPLVLEMKGPHVRILDASTRALSDVSREVIGQLRSAALHLFRREGIEKVRAEYGWRIDGLVPIDLLAAIEALPYQGTPNDEHVTELLIAVQDAGVSFIALLGQSNEFESAPDLLLTARAAFRSNGVMLFTYDELLTWNEVLLDFARSGAGLHEYFAGSRAFRTIDGTLCKFSERNILRNDMTDRLQDLILRTSDDICVFGMGAPPPHAPKGALKALMHFDVNRVLDPPTFLPGVEHLLWAGRYQGHWIVVKRRLSEPLRGQVIWYYFDPPITTPRVTHSMN